MAQINLAPGTQYAAAARRRRRLLYTAAAVLVVAMAGIWTLLFFLQQSAQAQLVTVQQELAAVETEIAHLGDEAKRVEQFEGRLTAFDQLLNQHISWDPVLAELERLLPPTTVLTSFQVNHEDRTMTVTGSAPSIDEVAQAFASLTDEQEQSTLFANAVISSVRRVEERDADDVVVASSYGFQATVTLREPAAGALPQE